MALVLRESLVGVGGGSVRIYSCQGLLREFDGPWVCYIDDDSSKVGRFGSFGVEGLCEMFDVCNVFDLAQVQKYGVYAF